MNNNIIELNSSSFESFVAKGNTIIDFAAEWCGPCKIMAPKLEEAAKELKGKVSFAKVDIEANYELAQKFSIMSIPTVIFFKNGEIVHSSVGAMSKEQIINLVNEVF